MPKRVVIVGGGVTGLSAARAMLERGVKEVVVLERRTLGSGGTGKSSGIVRCHYGVPSLAALAWRSLPLFEELGHEVGFHQVGYLLVVGAGNEDALRANVEMQQGLGVEVDEVSLDGAAALWPFMHVDDVRAAAHEPRAGYADAFMLAQHFAAKARSAGAVVRQQAEVRRLLVAGDHVTGVELSDGQRIDADVVVVAAGWWTATLLSGLEIDVPLEGFRVGMMVMRAGREVSHLPVLSDLVTLHYALPDGDDRLVVGNSDHSEPTYVHPDDYADRMTGPELERAAAKVTHRYEGFPDASVSHTYGGCYDITPDWNPVISEAGVEGLFVAAGFSGHGFKISPAVGDLVADLVLEGDSRDPQVRANDFRLSRFSDGDLLRSANPYAGAGEMR